MAKFKCLLSGNIFEFHTDFDIETMREHPQYEEIEEEEVVVKKKTTVSSKKTKKEAK